MAKRGRWLTCGLILWTAVVADAAPKPLKVLIVTGGCCHDYDVQKVLLKKGLEQRAHLDVEYVQQGGTATDSRIPLYENANWADGFDCVIHDECFSDAKDPQWVARVLKPHREGLPAVVMHCAMHCYRDGTDDWFRFCGVTSRQHGAHYPHEVLTRDGTHPIMKTLGAGWANPAGELYWIEKVWPTAHPLASAKNREKGNEEVCVWTNEFGEKKTRIFGTTLGHHNVTVEHPAFLDLVTRGTLWACGKLDDTYLKPPVTQRVPVNLALGKSAKASSEETGKNNFAKHAVDGQGSTRWCAANGSFPQTLEVDLGATKTVTGCGFKWESSNTVYQFRVEGSVDGKSWTVLADETKVGRNIAETLFDQRDLRHLKLTVTGSNTGGWASLWEWSVFGTESVAIDPNAIRKQADQAVLNDVKLPDGFEATVFATPPAVNYPVFVAAAPDGTVYVSSDKNGSLDREPRRGSILRLRDLDGDGRADESKLFVANVDSPRGLVWDRDRLYVMHPPHLSAFIDKNGDGISDEQKILVKNIAFGFKDRPADHTSNGVTLGIDGWLYLAIGDFGFLDAEGTDGRKLQFRSGGVVRVRPDGTGMEVFSRGTRNILEVAMDPLLNGFTRDNTNDGDGWDIRLHHFSGLEHHGYPSFYKNFSDEIVQPLADYGGGSGCGAMFLAEPGFPEGYSPALYTADWGRNWVYRHRMTPNGATFKPHQTEFIGSTRVTDLDVDASSRLYVTSWKGATFTYAGEDVGYLLQLKPKGYTAPALPDFLTLTEDKLVDQLRSQSHRRRLTAQRELFSHALHFPTLMQLQQLALDKSASMDSRVAALFTLAVASPGDESFELGMSLLLKDAALLPYILRAWGDRATAGRPLPQPVVDSSILSEDPRTRLEFAVAAGKLPQNDVTNRALYTLLGDADPVVQHTVVRALMQQKAAMFCLAMILQTPVDPKTDAVAIQVVQSAHEPRVVEMLIKQLESERDRSRLKLFFTALCRLHQREGVWKGNSWGTRPDTTGPYFQPETWEESPRIAAALQKRLEAAAPEEAAFLLTQLNRHKISLDGTLDRLLAMAAKDAALIPAAVTELSRAKTVPANAVELLKQVATDKERPQDQRLAAVLAWLRIKDEASFPEILRVLPTLDDKGKRRDLNALWSAFLNADRLGPHAMLLVDQSRSEDRELALWATAGLWALTSPKGRPSPEVRAIAEKALEAAVQSPSQRKLVIESLRLSNQREFADRIQLATGDEDKAVADLARDIAKQWKLELSPTPRGPKVSTLKPEEVIAAVMKSPGKVGSGEALFAKLNCAKCHTVKDGEPLRGPFLPNVAKTYKREQLAEAVLLPSKSLAQGFVTYVFTIDSGKTLTGFVTNEAADAITIRDNEGKELVLPVKEIEERAKSPVSVMPEGLVKDLTVDEFASLVAYLESLAPPK